MSIIEISNLTKDFGSVRALDNVSIEINEGEVFGYIGPNGAGKTTTIRTMLGILKATDGFVSIMEKDAWKDAVEIHKSIAFVPGDVSLWPNLTGGEVIDFFIKLRKSSIKNNKQELLEKFDLDPTKKCRTYSKGNRQKVALVAALATEADIYILDEPTSGLDPLMEKVFQDYVMSLKEKGKTIFLSSHILSEVEQLCDRVAIIREGKIVETGTIKELRHLMRNKIIIETANRVSDIENMEGVHDLVQNDKSISFHADTKDITKIMQHVDKFQIVAFESKLPSLEDLFMHHYKNGG